MTNLNDLTMSEVDVHKLNQTERVLRMLALVKESHALLEQGIRKMIIEEDREVAAICILYSGGNDSTVLAHLFKDLATCAVHANTTIGIEQTRQFVRDTCRDWGLTLKEYYPPKGSTYRDLVLDQGFPGPGMHFKMYQRLKERGLHQARREFVENPRKQRVVFLAGRRRTESARRANVPEMDRDGSIVWISPLVNWTKIDLQTYREYCGNVPRNEVSDLLHMSGECLCGAFAHKDEFSEIEMFFPEVANQIRELETEVIAAGLPKQKCKWGWGATDRLTDKDLKSGPLCSSCEYRNDLDGERP